MTASGRGGEAFDSPGPAVDRPGDVPKSVKASTGGEERVPLTRGLTLTLPRKTERVRPATNKPENERTHPGFPNDERRGPQRIAVASHHGIQLPRIGQSM